MYAPINVSATGAIVTPTAGKKVRITSLLLVAAASVTVTVISSGGTGLTGAMSLVVGVPLVLPLAPFMNQGGMPSGYGESQSGEGINLTLGGNVQVSGLMTYELVP